MATDEREEEDAALDGGADELGWNIDGRGSSEFCSERAGGMAMSGEERDAKLEGVPEDANNEAGNTELSSCAFSGYCGFA